MNDRSPNKRTRRMWTEEQDVALERLASAARQATHTRTPESREQVQLAVDAARDVGVGWTRIGDTLGIAGGNAYQKYRRKHSPDECCGQSAE